MGLLNTQYVVRSLIGNTQLEEGTLCYFYYESSVNLVPLFSDPQLKDLLANPLAADSTGTFGMCWMRSGCYRIEVKSRRGDVIATSDGIVVKMNGTTGYERGFETLSDLLEDTLMSYSAEDAEWFVTPGQLLKVAEFDGTYQIAETDATNHHLETSGGTKLCALRNERGFNVKQFGAIGDGVADDSSAVQMAINAAAHSGGGRVFLPLGIYRCASTIYVCHNATNNPGFPSDQLLGGRLSIEGDGAMTRRDYERDTYTGSVIAFAPGFRMELSKSGSSDQRGWRLRLCNFSLLGSNGTLIFHPYAGAFSEMEGLFIGNDGAVAGEATVYVSDNYVGRLQDLEIIGDKAFSGRVGIGLHIEPSDTAGGANTYANITAAFFDRAIMIGREYNAALSSLTNNSRAIIGQNLQGQYSNTGIHIMQGCTQTSLLGCWVEHCDMAGIRIDNSARNVEIISCNASMAGGEVGDRGLIAVGNSTGTTGIDAAYNVMVRNSLLFCTSGLAGVFVCDAAQDVTIENNSFHNGGGCAVGVQGGMGGEISLRSNNYFPETASTEFATVQRICQIQGAFGAATYTDLSYMPLELDFRPVAYTVDIDASGWRRPPRLLVCDTLSGSLTVTLPDLRNAGGCLARVLMMKPYTANDLIIDVQAGNNIQGAQTHVISAGYAAVELIHAGNGSTRWDFA